MSGVHTPFFIRNGPKNPGMTGFFRSFSHKNTRYVANSDQNTVFLIKENKEKAKRTLIKVRIILGHSQCKKRKIVSIKYSATCFT